MFCFFVRSRRLCHWLALGACLIPLQGWAQTQAPPSVVRQFEGLPREFESHFFDVPLAVRVELDGRYLGDAMVILTRDERVQLLEFTDITESREPPALRRIWQERLAAGRLLGDCTKNCPDGLQAIHYSLANSQLSLLTANAEKEGQPARYHSMPEAGSMGLLLRNQLNLVHDGNDTTGRVAFQGQGSLGNWTTYADAQADRVSERQGGTRYRMDQLYAEHLLEQHFFRLGYFTPGAQGLTRQPTLLGDSPDTTLGVMFGSSDSLLIDNGQPSSTPIYVTPNRQGVAEIYRNGVLINSQPVQPGLQTLDTRVLPGGIYEVEVRLLEDGQETSRTEAFIYKPSNWSNPESRWRYNLYLGQQTSLLNNWDYQRRDGLGAGVMSNYLLHPRAVLGLSAQQVDERMQYGTSLDWDALERLKLYGNVNYTEDRGTGYDLQAIHSYDQGSLVFSHSQSWVETGLRERGEPSRQEQRSQSSLSLSHRVTQRSSATVRLSHSSGAASGLGVDLGWAFFGKMLGTDTNWRLSVFDRPGTSSSGDARSRGVNLSLSMNLGGPGKRIAASVGSRTSRDGGSDRHGSLSYQQDVDFGPLQSLGASTTFDRYGAGFGGNAQLQGESLYGDAYAQTSTLNNKLSAGLNLQSMVAFGGGKMAVSGQYLSHEAGLIVDVDSDMEGLKLRADDYQGTSAVLHPGRNIIPVTAFKSGYVQFDFEADDAPAAVIQPSSLDYHLNRGGVEYRQLHVMRTVTVFGRLLDEKGQPIRGAHVINHASRGVSEVDGYFSVEMSQATPTLEIRQAGAVSCLLSLPLDSLVHEGDVVMAGDQVCRTASLADRGDVR
ncbi:CS1-pili formation C-terminal domain-containing protein [Pseudomonas sp. p1(2021b)]|uniref:CS1-pili formation C-terminal domain-containing protein n=1 Tax=Pseudomonas sp. p1(2021b) TaxID=2874628 RepID=UPI001CCC1F27|nr:CS1-pili formation C-terminal domain-containing protein [Pseudomonas sp. p1(2021b)]UBM26528.1 CS1-pili formation C-terminal domain-containing protein [Pseudomonas sp. p1(2021b)]